MYKEVFTAYLAEHKAAHSSLFLHPLPPYTETAVACFEARYGIAIPEDLRWYMTNISREYPLLEKSWIGGVCSPRACIPIYVVDSDLLQYTFDARQEQLWSVRAQVRGTNIDYDHDNVAPGVFLPFDTARNIARRAFAGDVTVAHDVSSDLEGVRAILLATRMDWSSAVGTWLWATGVEEALSSVGEPAKFPSSPLSACYIKHWEAVIRERYNEDEDADEAAHATQFLQSVQRSPLHEHAVPVIPDAAITEPDLYDGPGFKARLWNVSGDGYGFGLRYVTQCVGCQELTGWFLDSLIFPTYDVGSYAVPSFTAAHIIRQTVGKPYFA
jgi:hypothetical protein